MDKKEILGSLANVLLDQFESSGVFLLLSTKVGDEIITTYTGVGDLIDPKDVVAMLVANLVKDDKRNMVGFFSLLTALMDTLVKERSA